MKAIASGNPAVLTLAEADAELQRLAILKKNHADEQYLARRSLRDLPETIARLNERLAGLTADLATLTAHARRPAHHRRPGLRRSDAAGGARPAPRTPCRQVVMQTRRVPLGVYRGLALRHRAASAVARRRCTWKGRSRGTACFPATTTARVPCSTPSTGWPTATRPNATRTRQDLAIAEGQLRDYQARLGQPFAHDAYLAELTGLRDQLKAGLSGAEPQEGAPTVAELAEQIKALRASNSIEAAPERTGTRRVSAEEPVTARIRRRAEVHAAQPIPLKSRRRWWKAWPWRTTGRWPPAWADGPSSALCLRT